MIVVSDTTPLISLMKINRLELLKQLFGEIQVPEAVFGELIVNKHFPDENRMIMESAYIKRVQVQDEKAVELLRRSAGLDAGESEAIILSDTIGTDFLLMDEMKGRMVAQQMGITVMGTIGILMVAFKDNLLSKEEILSCIEILKMSGRHISDKLYVQLMDKLNGN